MRPKKARAYYPDPWDDKLPDYLGERDPPDSFFKGGFIVVLVLSILTAVLWLLGI